MELNRKNINDLPADLLQRIALDLRYDEIQKWCKTSKRFKSIICDNGRFWKIKIIYDFPDEKNTLEDKELKEMESIYLSILAALIEKDINDEISEIENEYYDEVAELVVELSDEETLAQEMKKLNKWRREEIVKLDKVVNKAEKYKEISLHLRE
jgi:hypothetical protein